MLFYLFLEIIKKSIILIFKKELSMWYHQIHDQDFYSNEIDMYNGIWRFTLLFNSKQKGNLYEFYLFFWEKFLKKIYFEVKINWPFMEEHVKGKEFKYFLDVMNKIRSVHLWSYWQYQEAIIPNKIYIEEWNGFFEDIFIYDEKSGELLWTKKWTFKIWNYIHIKRHFLIWSNNLDIFVYNIYKKKYEKPAKTVFSDWYFDNEKSEFIKYKNNFIYDNSSKKKDTDILCLMYNCKSINDFKEFFESCFSYKNLAFYFKPLNFFLNKVEEKIQDKLSKYHVYIKDLIIDHDSRDSIKRKETDGFISFSTYIDIKEETDIKKVLNKLNKDFKDYKVEIKQNKNLNSTDIKYQIILNFDVLLFRFWENFISTSLKEDDGFIQCNRSTICLSSHLSEYQNIENNYFVIDEDDVYKNDEHNVLKKMKWYEFEHPGCESHNSYNYHDEDNLDYTVLTKDNHVIIMKDWIELINEEIISSIDNPNSSLFPSLIFYGWRNYVAYEVGSNDIKKAEHVIYDFSKPTIRKIYLRNEDENLIYDFWNRNEDFFLYQRKIDIETKKETKIKKIRIPIKNMSISMLNQNEYVFNKKVDRKRIFTSSVFSNKEIDFGQTLNLNILDGSKFLYTNVWLKGVYQWVSFIPILKKPQLWNYKNTNFEKNFYCSNANSKFEINREKHFSLWTYLSKKVSKIKNYLNTNLDNWKFWSFVFKKDFLLL